MKYKLLGALVLFVALVGASWAQGSCSNFAAGSCPASVPAGVTKFYFFDYVGGSDSANGTSESTPWQHMPSCQNATSTSAAHTPSTGEGWIFKGGVTVDYHCWPANVPWGGSSGTPDYMGPDPGWFTSGSWARPIFSGGGSAGYNSNSGTMLGDSTHNAIYITIDNIEFTGLYWSGTNCQSSAAYCNYVAWHVAGFNVGGSSADGWEIKNIYAHNITHSAYPTSNDPSNTSAIFWIPRAANSSFHNNYLDNSDGGADCCWGVYAGNIYQNYFNDFDNIVFQASSSNNDNASPFLLHDNTINQMVTTFYPNNGSEPHGNCIHVFGTLTSSYKQLIYNNRVNCMDYSGQPTWGNAESFLWEEDGSVGYYFNNVNTNEYQGNGYNIGNFSGGSQGGTLTTFQNTNECGLDPNSPKGTSNDPGNLCVNVKVSTSTTALAEYNDVGFSSNYYGGAGVFLPSGWAGTFTSSPRVSKTCGGIATTTFGGTYFCVPIGVGNGTGNLNISQTYPFAPLDTTAASLIGTAANLISTCTAISAINSAAGTACLSDTTLGVSAVVSGHTVSFPARTPIAHATGVGQWEIGAYEESAASQAAPATCSPAFGIAPQTVTCMNPNSGTTVACYTTNGSTPATNGLGTGCATGTQYSTSISVSVAETIEIIAGASTLTDSTVNSYTYTSAPASNAIFTFGVAELSNSLKTHFGDLQ